MSDSRSDSRAVAESGGVKVPGGRLAYEVAGNGPPMVFIHAAIADRRQWDREMAAYAHQHRVVRYDTRGYGGSTPAGGSFSNAEDLAAIIAHVRMERPLLVGCSMGGAVAIDLAIAHPELVGGLFLVAPGISGGFHPPFAPDEQAALDEDDRRSAEVSAAWSRGDERAAFEHLRNLWCGALKGEALDRFRQMVDTNREEVYADRSGRLAERPPAAAPLLGRVQAPTTVLVGDRDNPSMPMFAQRIAAGIPGARLARAPGADHLVNLSAPSAFDQELRQVTERRR